MTILNNQQATIDTVVPALKLGEIQISADRRSTEKQKLSDAERIRRVVLPANHWPETAATINGERNQSLTDILRSALVSIASDRLKDILATDPMTRVVSLADFTISALLTWNADTASSRGSITFTRDQVEAWFPGSATAASLKTRAAAAGKPTAAVLDFAGKRFATLAAKNHGLKDVADAEKLAAVIDPADLEGEHASLVTEILGRLEHIKKSMQARAATESISMDDL